jgi:hypothetical protein
MPSQNRATELLDDRVKFKLFAAEYHLSRLEDIERRTGSLVSNERIQAEVEIDGFLCEIIGAKDALLQEINQRLRLGLAVHKVDLGSVNKEITWRGLSPSITSELNIITQPCYWLWKLNEYRNHSVHRSMIVRFIRRELDETIHLTNNQAVPTPELARAEPAPKTYLVQDPRDPNSGQSDVEVIPYFRDCLQKMSDIVGRTRSSLP